MKHFIPFILFILLVSCTKTSVVSIKQNLLMRPTFHSVLVAAPYENLELKVRIENLCIRNIGNANIKVYRAFDILPPLRTYTQSEISEILKSRNIEALLIVAISDFWVDYYSSPGKTVTHEQSTSMVSGTIQQWGSLLSVSTQETGFSTSTTQYIPGKTFTKSNVRLDARVARIDLNKEPLMIWRANSTTSGNFLTSTSQVLADAIREIAKQLVADGIIADGPRANPLEVRLVGGDLGEIELGCISCPEWHIESIFNTYGTSGARANHSIWNPKSSFGDVASESCPCNPSGTSPPRIIDKYGEHIGYLSINPNYPINYKPQKLLEWLERKLCISNEEQESVPLKK